MLKLLRQGKASGLIIHKIDRGARNLKDWADLGELSDQGVEVHLANESLDLNSRSGRLSADIQAVVASDYIRNLREETKKGIYGRLKQGLYPLAAPLGYLDNGKGKPKTIDPDKGPLIRKAFELYATTRFNILELCDELFRLGLRNRKGNRVTRNGLSIILNNPFYIGLIRIRKTGQMFQGVHEPLISKRILDEVQDILSGRFNTKLANHAFAFRRIIKCKLCRYSLVGETQKGHVYYRCHTPACPTVSIREEAVEEAVAKELQKLQFTDAEKQYLAGAITDLKRNWITDKERQLSVLNMKLHEISERLNRLTDAYLDRTIDKDTFEERKGALLFERHEIEEGVNGLRNGSRSIPDKLHKFLELAQSAYLLHKSAIPEKKRRMLKLLTSNLILEAKSVDFTFSVPFNEVANRDKSTTCSPHKGIGRTLDQMIAKLSAHFAQKKAESFDESSI